MKVACALLMFRRENSIEVSKNRFFLLSSEKLHFAWESILYLRKVNDETFRNRNFDKKQTIWEVSFVKLNQNGKKMCEKNRSVFARGDQDN